MPVDVSGSRSHLHLCASHFFPAPLTASSLPPFITCAKPPGLVNKRHAWVPRWYLRSIQIGAHGSSLRVPQLARMVDSALGFLGGTPAPRRSSPRRWIHVPVDSWRLEAQPVSPSQHKATRGRGRVDFQGPSGSWCRSSHAGMYPRSCGKPA